MDAPIIPDWPAPDRIRFDCPMCGTMTTCTKTNVGYRNTGPIIPGEVAPWSRFKTEEREVKCDKCGATTELQLSADGSAREYRSDPIVLGKWINYNALQDGLWIDP